MQKSLNHMKIEFSRILELYDELLEIWYFRVQMVMRGYFEEFPVQRLWRHKGIMCGL